MGALYLILYGKLSITHQLSYGTKMTVEYCVNI